MAADETRDSTYGEKLAAVMGSSGFRWDAIDPEWQAMFQAYVRDGMYQRDVLDPKTRELCAVAALVVLDRQRALRKHLLAALDYGATREEVLEVILQMSVLGGFPVTLSALETFRDLADE